MRPLAAFLIFLTAPVRGASPIIFDRTFGGSGDTSAAAIALDAHGNIYVAGGTSSGDFPTRNAFQPRPGGAPLLTSLDGGKTWMRPPLGVATTVYSIAAAPSAPATIYAATNVGVWESLDGGVTWTLLANNGLTGHLQTISVDAGSPTLVYAATDDGVFISSDSGAIWGGTNVSVSPGAAIVVADPGIPGTVFAIGNSASGSSWYRSSDSGRTWSPVDIPGFSLVFSPQNPSVIFAIGGRDGIEKSTDGGNSWSLLSSQHCSSLVFDPSNASNLYCGDPETVFKSTDGGQTFAEILALSNVDAGELVAIDPRNPAAIYVASPGALWRSGDGGNSWSHSPMPAQNPYPLMVSAVNSRVLVGATVGSNAFVTKWSPDGTQLLYATYLGGSNTDGATGIAVDGEGNAYVTGSSTSPDFPVTANAPQSQLVGMTNAFVAKISADGSQLVYATLLGGGNEGVGPIAVDASGSAVITGSTEGGFPLTANAIQTTVPGTCPGGSAGVDDNLDDVIGDFPGSAFVAKLAPDGGSLIYSTLLGGTTCGASGSGVAIAPNGDAWIVGNRFTPYSPAVDDFPITPDAIETSGAPGANHGFLARFDSSGNLAYSSYVAGSFYDTVSDIALDAAGAIYLTGVSAGLAAPASPGAYASTPAVTLCNRGVTYPAILDGDNFVLKLDAEAHSFTGLTYLGAQSCGGGGAIAVDASGSPWITVPLGLFGGPAPTVRPVQLTGSGYISKFSADLKQLEFSTPFDGVEGMAADGSNLYVAGYVFVSPPVSVAFGGAPGYFARIDVKPAAVSLNNIVSAGTKAILPFAAAPGEVVRLLGSNLGPAASATAMADASGFLPTSLDGVEVTFDGLAAPLLSVSAGEIDCVAPFELAGKTSTTIQVRYKGKESNQVMAQAAPMAMNVLAVLNSDMTPNSQSNPAQAGSTMTIYISGAGQTNPPSQDGQINTAPYAAPEASLIVGNSDTNQTFTVLSAQAAPGMAAGIFQINFVAPANPYPQPQQFPDGYVTSNGSYVGIGGFDLWVQ